MPERSKPAVRTIKQTVTFKAAPEEVYEALMSSRRHAGFTGSRASISPRVGGRIMAYDGYIRGLNLELVPGKRIVQSWRASDWPAGVESRVIFVLKRAPGGTRLEFTQRGVPWQQVEDLRRGWIEHYWEKMSGAFEAGKVPPLKRAVRAGQRSRA